MLRVVNVKKDKLIENEILVMVDRNSPLGNPFKMNNYSNTERNRVCEMYKTYFDVKVKEKGDFRNEVVLIYSLAKKGYNVALGCHCAPLRCHAEYIKQFVEQHL